MPSLTEVNREAESPSMFRKLFEMAAGGPLPEWQQVAADMDERVLPAGATVFDQDTEHPYLYAVRHGLVKLCYLDEEGNEWIKSFAEEGRFFGSIAALQPGGRTSFLSMTMEASRLERVAYATLMAQARRHIAWANAIQKMTLAFAARKEARERHLLTLSPESRYRAFHAESPELETRIPQKDLARYLGLTPVGLNRIVRRVRDGAVEGP
jgi:CRP-like cAMP-binding protein